MKRYIKFLMIALSAGAVLAACTRESDTDVAGGKEIRFSASVGQFQVKATATAFEEGDAIGLFSTEPVDAQNARLSFSGGSLTPDTPICWGDYQPEDQAVTFYAYYPYVQGCGSNFNFSVAVDQSAAGAYEAADLMTASVTATPADEAVQLHFAHRMVRAILNIDNRIGGEISEVYVNNVGVDVSVDLLVPSVGLIDDGKLYSVKAAPVADPTGTRAWSVILPSQFCNDMSITVKLSSGKEYTIRAEETIYLEEGRSYTVGIIVDEALNGLNFNVDVSDWLDVWAWMGKDSDPGKLPVTWSLSQNGVEYEMELQEDGLWHGILPSYNSWAEFQVVKNNHYYDKQIPYRQYFGVSYPDYYVQNVEPGDVLELALSPDRLIRLQSEADVPMLECWLDADARKLTVSALDHQWEYLGTGSMVESAIASLFGLPKQELDVEIDVDGNTPGVYRVRTPYKNWELPNESFTYTGGEDLIIYSNSYGEAYFNQTFTGIYNSEYGNLYFASDRGAFDDYNQVFHFWSANFYFGNSWESVDFVYVPMYVVLPGGERPTDMNLVLDYMGYDANLETVGAYAFFDMYTGMDVAEVRVGVYSGYLSNAEMTAKVSEVKQSGMPVEFIPQIWSQFRVSIDKTGSYTLLAVAKDATGKNTNSSYARFSVLLDGEAPEAEISIVAEPGIFAEAEVDAHVTFASPDVVYTVIMDDASWQKAGLSDDDIYDYVMNNGKNSLYNVNSEGVDIYFGGLQPDTKYHILLAGVNAFQKEGWATAEVTTGSVPSFSLLGTGHYSDNFYNMVGPDGYYTEVQILKSNTDPVRYRALEPYKAYWENPNEGYDSYFGESAPWIDFCIVDGNFYYLPYLTGYLESGYGEIEYNCRNKYSGAFYSGNCEIEEGVYNIAPIAYILGTNYMYNLTTFSRSIYLEMPGYKLTPLPDDPNYAPARRASRVREQ